MVVVSNLYAGQIAAACKGSLPCLRAATSNRQMGAAYIPLPSNCLNATECTMQFTLLLVLPKIANPQINQNTDRPK